MKWDEIEESGMWLKGGTMLRESLTAIFLALAPVGGLGARYHRAGAGTADHDLDFAVPSATRSVS